MNKQKIRGGALNGNTKMMKCKTAQIDSFLVYRRNMHANCTNIVCCVLSTVFILRKKTK